MISWRARAVTIFRATLSAPIERPIFQPDVKIKMPRSTAGVHNNNNGDDNNNNNGDNNNRNHNNDDKNNDNVSCDANGGVSTHNPIGSDSII